MENMKKDPRKELIDMAGNGCLGVTAIIGFIILLPLCAGAVFMLCSLFGLPIELTLLSPFVAAFAVWKANEFSRR